MKITSPLISNTVVGDATSAAADARAAAASANAATTAVLAAVAPRYLYSPSGDTSGVIDSTPVKSFLESGALSGLAPGTYYLKKPYTTLDVAFATISNKSGWVDLSGVTFVLVGDPSLDLGDGTKNYTYGRWFDILSCVDYGWIGKPIIRHFPELSVDAVVQSISGTDITIQVAPGQTYSFPYVGAIGCVPNSNESPSRAAWQHTKVAGTNEPEALVTRYANNVIKFTLRTLTSSITGATIVSGIGGDLAKITLQVANSAGFNQPIQVQIDGITSGLTSGGTSVLNGSKFAVKLASGDDDDSNDDVPANTGIELSSLYSNSNKIFPNNTTAWVSGGTISTVAPNWLVPGAQIQVSAGKKRGGHFLLIGNRGTLKFDVVQESCSGIGYFGKNNENVEIPITAGNIRSPMSFNHGAILLVQTWGTFKVPSYFSGKCGDSHIAASSGVMQGITSVGANTVTVSNWSSSVKMDNLTPLPVAGRAWGYMNPTGNMDPLVNIITDVTGTTVTFSSNHPGSFNYGTWKMIPLDANKNLYIGDMYARGGWTAALTPFFRRVEIDNLWISEIGAEAIRISTPGIRWANRTVGAQQTSVRINNAYLNYTGYGRQEYGKAAIVGRSFNSSDGIASLTNRPKIEIGYLNISNTPLGIFTAAGVDLKVGMLTTNNNGLWRSNTIPGSLPVISSPDALNDLYAENGSITIGSIYDSSNLTVYRATGGSYTPPGGLRAPVRGTTTTGQTIIASPIPVLAGMEWMVRVFLNSVELDPGISYTADGSTNLTLTTPATAGLAWRIQKA